MTSAARYSALGRGRVAGGTLDCTVLTSFDEATCPREQWDALVAEVGGDIYLTYDWCQAWWTHYGAGRELRVLRFTQGDRWVGLLPLFIERLWVGPLSVRVARLLGADFTMGLLNPPVAREHASEVYRVTLNRALGEFGCDAIDFGSQSGETESAGDIRAACAECPAGARILRERASTVYTVFHLPGSFEQYLDSLSKNERDNYRRDLRRLTAAHPLRYEVHRGSDGLEDQFAAFVRMHEAQWRQQGKAGHFGDWPRAREFTLDLVRRLSALQRVEIETLRADAEPIAYQLNFRFGTTLHARLAARSTGPEWERHGIGRIALLKSLEQAIQQGTSRYEAGPAHYDYKVRLGGKEYPLHSVVIVRDRPWARWKTGLLLKWADLIHLLYFRIWFLRVAPRLPLPRRPLWKLWIRSRL